jgi:trigger factor
LNITLDKNDEQLTGLLTVHIDQADYTPVVEKQLKAYAKTAQVKGFRPGMVPAGMVKKLYGKGVLGEELNKMLGKAVDTYIKEHKLRLLGEALPMPTDVELDLGQDFEFKFEMGFLPDFSLPLADLNLDLHKVSVDDDTLAQTNEQITRQFGDTENPETSEAGDYLFGKLKQADAEGEGQTVLLPISKVTGNQAQFVGVKPGDALTFDLKAAFGGDATAISNFSGLTKAEAEAASGDYVLTVEKINRTKAPEMNQELFDKVFGPDTVASQEEFDAKVREIIQQNYDREAENSVANRLVEALVEKTDIKLPVAFFKKWLVRVNEGKLTADKVEENYSTYEKELKWSMIRNKVVEDTNLQVSENEIVERTLDKIMGQFNMPNMAPEMREQMRSMAVNYLNQENGKLYMQEYEAILADKVLADLRGKIVVTEKPVTAEEFRNLHS